MRGALAAVHNVEALLRNERVHPRTIRDLIPELRASAAVLRQEFEKARSGGDAAAAVGAYGLLRVKTLRRLLDEIASLSEDREKLAARAPPLEEELEAAADVLAVLERAEAPSPTEVTVERLVREAGRLWGSGCRGHFVSVRLHASAPDGVVMTDPYVAVPLLALLVTRVHSAAAGAIVVRARCTETQATFHVGPGLASDAVHPAIAMRVMPCLCPTSKAAIRLAEALGGALELRRATGLLALPLAGA